jgi:hypothetical protein
MKYTIVISVFCLILSYCRYEKQQCVREDFEELRIEPVHISFMTLPFKIVDTTLYGPSRTMYTRRVQSLDSLLEIFIFVDDYHDYANDQLDINTVADFQKQEVESGNNAKRLLEEGIKNVNDLKVGYLKYLVEQGNKKFYASRIFFYKDKKLVILWLFDDKVSEKPSSSSVSDCVLGSLRIY